MILKRPVNGPDRRSRFAPGILAAMLALGLGCEQKTEPDAEPDETFTPPIESTEDLGNDDAPSIPEVTEEMREEAVEQWRETLDDLRDQIQELRDRVDEMAEESRAAADLIVSEVERLEADARNVLDRIDEEALEQWAQTELEVRELVERIRERIEEARSELGG